MFDSPVAIDRRPRIIPRSDESGSTLVVLGLGHVVGDDGGQQGIDTSQNGQNDPIFHDQTDGLAIDGEHGTDFQLCHTGSCH